MPDSPYQDSMFVMQFNLASGAVVRTWHIADSHIANKGQVFFVGPQRVQATVVEEVQYGVDLSRAGYTQYEDGVGGLLGYWPAPAAAAAPVAYGADALATAYANTVSGAYGGRSGASGPQWTNYALQSTQDAAFVNYVQTNMTLNGSLLTGDYSPL